MERFRRRTVKDVRPVVVDEFNKQTIVALYRKLHRDYMGFFRSLSDLYGRSPQKKRIHEGLLEVRKVLTILEGVISKDRLTKEDIELVVEKVNKINSFRDEFLDQAQKVGALERRLEKIREETGIAPEDLNVTEQIVRKVARTAARPPTGVLPFLRRVAPRTTALVGEVGRGAAAAAFGPFYPIAREAFGVAKDIWGIGREVTGRVRAARERKLEAGLRPIAAGLPEEEFVRGVGRRAEPPLVSAFGGVSRRLPGRMSQEEAVAPLVYFFNRKADKAKWTKDVLKKISDLGKPTRGFDLGFLSELKDKFLTLGGAIVPLILKGAGFAALALGVGNAVVQFNKLRKVWSEWVGAKKAAEKAGERAGAAARQKIEYIKEVGLKEYAAKAGKTERQVALDIAGLEQREALAKRMARPWYMKTLQAYGLAKRPELVPTYKRVEELETGLTRRGPATPVVEEESMKNLTNAMNNLTGQLGKQISTPTTRDVGLGNIFDSGDPLVNRLATGSLTIQGD